MLVAILDYMYINLIVTQGYVYKVIEIKKISKILNKIFELSNYLVYG